MFCRNCGKELIGTPEICMNCGARPLVGGSFCHACGAATNPLAEICVKCGVRLTKAEEVGISPKSRLTTTLLAWFLGIFGAHRFYLRKTKTAIVMLILTILYLATVQFWGMIMVIALAIVGLWAFTDFIFAVSGIMKDKEGRLIKNWQS